MFSLRERPARGSIESRIGTLRRQFERLFAGAIPRSMARPPANVLAATPAMPVPRVLVVDDNPANLWEAGELLSQWGITARKARDGCEAVTLACSETFDLILMDLQMPLLDGLGATRQIRLFELEHGRTRVPVVAYTSSPVSGDVWRHCGLDAVLDKPGTTQDIQRCLARWCAPFPALVTRLQQSTTDGRFQSRTTGGFLASTGP